MDLLAGPLFVAATEIKKFVVFAFDKIPVTFDE
jgi:hypothetical protein